MHSQMRFFFPSKTRTTSLTGTWCALNCAHCGRHYLKNMTPIERVGLDGAASLLISGGYDHEGRAPVLEKLGLVRQLKEQYFRLKLNWHVGLLGEEAAQAIASLADAISFDFVGDDATIREVYGLEATAEDYLATYRMLRRHARVVPHITLGLLAGQMKGEYRALELLAGEGLEELVLLVFRPTAGTRYADRRPPAIEEVARFFSYARAGFPQATINLGCMRPGGTYRAEVDRQALLLGLDGIVQPAPTAIKLAGELGLEVSRYDECCVFA